jgi:hypothetical protein
MSTKNKVPSWVKERKQILTPQKQKLFLFPEGKTKVSINMEKAPREIDLGSGMRSIYSATIENKDVEFCPSKTLEKMILAELEQGHNVLNIYRAGTEITNTKYTVQALE